MRSTFSILPYINRNKVKADGTTAVLCRITIDGKSSTMATGIYCKPEDWNSKTGTIRTVRENNRLQEFRKSVGLAYDEILKKQNVVSAELLKNTLAKRAVIPTKLLQMGERERERLLARSKEINSTSTYRHSGYYQKYLKDYLTSLGKEDIGFTDITEDFGSSYKAFLKRYKNFSPSQTNKCLCWLSKLVYLAVDYEILRANPLEDMEYEKKPAPKHRHISRAELKAILETPMLDPLQELGRRAFLFSSFTGLAYVDTMLLHPHHIGWILFDVLMCKENMQAAKALMENRFGPLDVKAVLYSHSHVDHFGGAEGAIDRNDVADPSLSVDKQLASGKTVILAPKGFLKHAISENVYAGMDSGEMTLVDETTGDNIPLLCSFSERQKAILKAGGLLKYVGQGNH